MKTNRMRLLSLTLWFIVLTFGIGACAPSAPVPASALSAVDACDVSKISFTNIHWFQEPDGAWRVVGMIHNNSDRPVAKVFMDVLTKNKNDESVFPETSDTVHPTGPEGEDFSAYPLNLLPGSQAPFSAWIKRDLPGLDHFTIKKNLCVVAEQQERLQLQERAGQLLVDDGSGRAEVTLELVNPGTQAAMVDGTMIGLFDASNQLITAVYADVTPRVLAPGESGPVRATLALPAGSAEKVKSYKLYMDALVNVPVPKLLDVKKDIQVEAQYVDAAGHFHLVGQITNPGTKPLMTSLQATVYLDAARTSVVDASSLDTLVPLAPGASMPFDLTDWRVLNNKGGLGNALSKRNAAIVLRVEPFRTWIAETSVAPLTVIAESPAFNSREATFSGQVKNETGHNIILGTVTATLRDSASKKVIAAGQTSLNIVNALADGETLSYSITIPIASGFDPQTVQFEVTASGQQT